MAQGDSENVIVSRKKKHKKEGFPDEKPSNSQGI